VKTSHLTLVMKFGERVTAFRLLQCHLFLNLKLQQFQYGDHFNILS